MKIVLQTGNYEIEPIITIKYLETKNIPFYVYHEDYSFDTNKTKYVYIPKEEYNMLDNGYFVYVLPSFLESEFTDYRYLPNRIELDLNDLRFDKDFIRIVEENETYNLRVVEVPEGIKYKIDCGYSGYDDEWYERIEIYNEDEWKIAE